MAREKRRGGNAVMMPARQAAQTAEDDRLIGLQRQEESFVAAEKARALAREQEAIDVAQAEAARARQAAREAQAAQAARDLAERQAQRFRPLTHCQRRRSPRLRLTTTSPT